MNFITKPPDVISLLLIMILLSGCTGKIHGIAAPSELHCEYRVNPLNVEAQNPRLGWIMMSNRRSWKQTAYRVLVASGIEKLNAGEGDLWDSGRVESDQSVHVEYQGKKLDSSMRVYWKVRVWDDNGKASSWSEPSFWEMGLLEPDDWKAKWIGYD